MLPRGATMVTSPSNSVHTLGRGVGRNPDLVCGIHACGYTHLARLLRQIVGFDANHPRLGFWWSTALVFLAFSTPGRGVAVRVSNWHGVTGRRLTSAPTS